MLIKSRTFWIATAIFLLLGGGVGWLVFPRLYHTFQTQRAEAAKLDSQIESETKYVLAVKTLAKQQSTIDSLHQTAENLLPTSLGSDVLSLQLEGLVNSLGLTNFSVTVPFTGSAAAAQPTVKGAAATNQNFTLAGSANFTQLKTILAALKSFGRWNKISSVEITQSGTSTNVTVVSNVFSRATAPPAFNGTNTNLLTQAATLFNQYKAYATTPDVTTEGSFGRPDPFAAK